MLRLIFWLALTAAACAPIRRNDASALKVDDSAARAELDEKLAKQWQKYAEARTFILDEVAVKKLTVTREQWDAKLALTGTDALTAADLQTLKARQAEMVQASRQDANARSTLSLARLRQLDQVDAFCKSMPKGGLLHIHPWGTLDRETVKKVLDAVNPFVPFAKLKQTLNAPGETGTLYTAELVSLNDVASHYPEPTAFKNLSPADQTFVIGLFFLPPGNHPFDRFTAVFTSISALTFAHHAVDPEPLQWEGFLKRAHEHHVRYVEVSRNVIPKPVWINGLDAWAQEMEQKYGVVVRLHAAFNRTNDAAYTRTKTEQLLALPPSKILNGIDILADETAFPALEFGQTLYVPVLSAVQNGTSSLHRTAHAGELGDIHNPRDMMIMGAERIGHGVLLKDDPVALEFARLHAFPVEVNLVSNRRLKVVEDPSKHPYLHFLRLGLKVSLSTDDEGIFESTIDDECTTAINETDVTYDEMRRMAFNAIETSFADDQTKSAITQDLTTDFAAFESAWSVLVP